jgi:cell division protein FtsW (lipid II flippase)
METKNLSNVRRFALIAVVGNFAAVALAASVLPRELLPIVGLVLPLLSLGIIEAAAENRVGHQLAAS